MDLFAGFISGIAQTIVGHPFNTIKTWKQVMHIELYNLKSLYRGVSFPLLSSGIINSVSFKTYEYYKSKNEPIKGSILAGSVFGITSYPFELYKLRKQIGVGVMPKVGMITILLRDIPASIFYYPVYDYMRQHNWPILLSGGIAGCGAWLISYPMDVLHTHVIKNNNLITTMRELKWNNYTRGLTFALYRGFIVNAIGYLFYEMGK